ncbi:Ribose transport system permease protein RbsC [Novipirellula galeiformis]|uniref:Ribose transport system permease protein RbsC n=1 Tax=Novipirellula galeiformis TaxID=2528004 RepID=A0A5C6CVJ7_9BACT|nr:ABC transporter permease [Novipirellula galeiformis]TWU26996.1 Ribose transport system permease protein RbsC [Novipirellula galeiformis]
MHFKNIGIFALLIAIIVITSCINGVFVAPANLKTLVRDTSLYGLISIGVAMVIITGGIDLSIGSMIALCGVMLVQVIHIRYERTDFASTIAAVQNDPTEASDKPSLRLVDPPPELRDGDRLVYESYRGESTLNVYRSIQVEDQVWIQTHDSLRSIQAGLAVKIDKIRYTPPLLACAIVLLFAALLGYIHGILITRANLQPFVVTLCGLLIYRGMARVWTGDDQVGLLSALSDFKATVTGKAFQIPVPLIGKISGERDSLAELVWIDFPVTGVLLAIVALVAWIFLNRTVWGRHLLATGENKQAAIYSGVASDRLIILSYVVSAVLAGLAGILFLLEWNSIQPGSSGSFYELYAIAAAVLGGCSLRGGRGAILGVIAGAAVMRCLYKAIVVLEIPQEWEMVIIGIALLTSVLVDEIIRRFQASRRLRRHTPTAAASISAKKPA